jgi:phosphoribosylamine--glycine ligase
VKILIIGSGGREHAIAWKLAQSPLVSKIFCCPGNGGTAQIAENIAVDPNSVIAMAEFAITNQIDLTVVGPETYLAQGMTDFFQLRGLKIYGPSRSAAQLESSKVFSKEFMKKYQIPTAAYQVFTDPFMAKEYIQIMGTPIVIKADGLAAGKGVVVAFDLVTALKAVDEIMTDKVFGESGASILVEEFLEGEEFSLLAFCDGEKAIPMLPVQDHKRISDGDMGPNTGGMGTYAPTSAYTKEIADRVVMEILNPTMIAMKQEGTPFIGTLFIGLMLTKNGPKVIEYNVRFGDPEIQVLLPLLESDLAVILIDAVSGRLDPNKIQWKKDTTAACLVTASAGYPGPYETDKVIEGLEELKDSIVFHAATKPGADGVLLTAGGRVLNLIHLGANIKEAIDGIYQDVKKIHFEGMYFRTDIGKRELERFK